MCTVSEIGTYTQAATSSGRRETETTPSTITQVKFKFYATCSAPVGAVNAQRSVALTLDNTQVDNVTIPFNFDVPRVGDIVEVRYLYYNPDGALYQSTYLGVRDDIDVDACTLAQLKHKSAVEEETWKFAPWVIVQTSIC